MRREQNPERLVLAKIRVEISEVGFPWKRIDTCISAFSYLWSYIQVKQRKPCIKLSITMLRSHGPSSDRAKTRCAIILWRAIEISVSCTELVI